MRAGCPSGTARPLCHPRLGTARCPLPPPATPLALPQPLGTALLCLCRYSRSSSSLICVAELILNILHGAGAAGQGRCTEGHLGLCHGLELFQARLDRPWSNLG